MHIMHGLGWPTATAGSKIKLLCCETTSIFEWGLYLGNNNNSPQHISCISYSSSNWGTNFRAQSELTTISPHCKYRMTDSRKRAIAAQKERREKKGRKERSAAMNNSGEGVWQSDNDTSQLKAFQRNSLKVQLEAATRQKQRQSLLSRNTSKVTEGEGRKGWKWITGNETRYWQWNGYDGGPVAENWTELSE